MCIRDRLGIPIVDTDVIAHELTAVGSPILAEISLLFGKEFITESGALDRAKLRAHVFEQPAERLKLEALLHPLIRTSALKQLAENEHQLNPIYQICLLYTSQSVRALRLTPW